MFFYQKNQAAKKIACFLILSCIFLTFLMPLFTSCRKSETEPKASEPVYENAKDPYTTYRTDLDYKLLRNETEAQIPIYEGKRVKDRECPKEKDIVFRGKEYHCEYNYSYRPADWQNSIDFYDCFDPSEAYGDLKDYIEWRFIIDHETGRLISWYKENGIKLFDEAPEDLEQYLIGKAAEAASEYISVGEYEQSVLNGINYLTDYGLFQRDVFVVCFTRYVGEYATSERLNVQFSSNGLLLGVSMQNIGTFKDLGENDLPKIDLERINAAVEEYWTKERYDMQDLRFGDRFLARAQNGQLLLVTCMDTYYQSKNVYLRNGAAVSTVLPEK